MRTSGPCCGIAVALASKCGNPIPCHTSTRTREHALSSQPCTHLTNAVMLWPCLLRVLPSWPQEALEHVDLDVRWGRGVVLLGHHTRHLKQLELLL